MNIQEINPGTLGTLAHYLEACFSFTLATVWIILAFQGKFHGDTGRDLRGIAIRLAWPVNLIRKLFVRPKNRDRNHIQMQDNIGYQNGEAV